MSQNMANKVNVLLQRLSEAVEVRKLFAPSTIGVIAGLVVAATPQLKEKLVGEGAPLRFVQDSITLLGNGTIPSLILITGGNLIKGINGPGMGPSLVIGVVLIRFVLLPIVGTIIVECAAHVGLVHSDPLFRLVILLQHAVPPAMNTASMIQMLNAGESELSVIFFLVIYLCYGGDYTLVHALLMVYLLIIFLVSEESKRKLDLFRVVVCRVKI
ncbi:hypothetical protein HPP92_027854 [Vanilla planifolia]|uniref:PIN-like protein n=1 Tax=Vanilla planifolia TaxID=51239 RepID=A0A835U5A8_VANPL|nr:hypothetical protein HPP92_027854 [Vanilla planifolia]